MYQYQMKSNTKSKTVGFINNTEKCLKLNLSQNRNRMMTVWDLKKIVKLSKRYFKQTRFVVLIKLKMNTKNKNIKCLKILEPSNEHTRNLIIFISVAILQGLTSREGSRRGFIASLIKVNIGQITIWNPLEFLLSAWTVGCFTLICS